MNLHLPRKSILFCAGFAGLFVALGSFHPTAQPRQVKQVAPTPPTTRPSKHSDLPPKAAEFNGNSYESPADVARRHERESHHRDFYRKAVADPGAPAGGDPESSHVTFLEYYGAIDPFPASAAAVVIGTVVAGQSYVSSDRTYVYSDYKVQVDSILKQDPIAKLTTGTQVTVSRPGGSVHFPSGHLTHFLVMGTGFPKVGAKYLLFLSKLDPDATDYEVATAYELDGLVQPLDDYEPQFEGMSSTAFLAKVKDAIANPPKGQS
jgi:hypothetical protein